jgi:hypothetical protein
MKGQAKKDFEKWLKKSYNGYSVDFYLSLPKAFKYVVIVDWFDSVGICIEILKQDVWFFVAINLKSDGSTFHQTRPQARQKAIEKATEIYNKRYEEIN